MNVQLTQVERRVLDAKAACNSLWLDKGDPYWLFRLLQETGELASVLAGDHDDTIEHELVQIASIAMNWLEKLEREAAPISTGESTDPPIESRIFYIYTDGGCSRNPGNGGWGYVIVENNKTTLAEGHNLSHLPNVTNNQMEIIAAINAINELCSLTTGIDKAIIHSDSRYLIETARRKWNIKTDNRDTLKAWDDLFSLIDTVRFPIEWDWIPRDSNWYNKRADLLSNKIR